MEAIYNQTQILPHIYEEVKKRFLHIHDLAHGWDHVRRVYQMACYIAEKEQADLFIVGAAALMHDLGQTIPHHERQEHHAEISVEQAKEILDQHGVAKDQEEAISHAILAHSFSYGQQADTLEARVVRDADRLDALGALGILRWAIVGTQRSTPEMATHHPDDPLGDWHSLDDRLYMLDHFRIKLLKLGATMGTETGKQIATERTAFMKAYLEEFKHEIEMLKAFA